MCSLSSKEKTQTGKEAETLKRLLALMMVVAVTAALLACTKGEHDNEDGNDDAAILSRSTPARTR